MAGKGAESLGIVGVIRVEFEFESIDGGIGLEVGGESGEARGPWGREGEEGA